jgi:uncharacterized membrane protein
MSVMAWVYIAYILVCTVITLWVGAVLRRNGATFVGHGTDLPEPLVKSMTHLLTVGFYLVNFGLIAFALKSSRAVTTSDTAIELASTKIGGVTLLIGAMHFFMLLIFSKLRHSEVLEPVTRRTISIKPAP